MNWHHDMNGYHCPSCAKKLGKFLRTLREETKNGENFHCPECKMKIYMPKNSICKIKRAYNLPKYAKVGGVFLRRKDAYKHFGLKKDVFHKDAGNWHIEYVCEPTNRGRKVLVSKKSDKRLKHLYGKELKACSKEEWEQDNLGYLPSDKWGQELQYLHVGIKHMVSEDNRIAMAIDGAIALTTVFELFETPFIKFSDIGFKQCDSHKRGFSHLLGRRHYNQKTGIDGVFVPNKIQGTNTNYHKWELTDEKWEKTKELTHKDELDRENK